LELENYNYKIEHRPGESMPHVEALSRQMELLSNKVERVMEEPCVVPESSEKSELIESSEKSELVESSESLEKSELVESSESSELIESSEKSELVESSESLEKSELLELLE